MKALIPLFVLVTLGTGCVAAETSKTGSSRATSLARPAHLVDLTHTLSPSFPFIPVQNKTFPFRLSPIATMDADGVYANRWELTEHVGTHLDAPNHFHRAGAAVDAIPLAALIAPAVVIDLAARVAAEGDDVVVEIADLEAWERAHGPIADGAAVLVHTGWESRIAKPPTFVNMDAKGTLHFPGFGLPALDFLLTRRRIVGIGIDTLSIDPGRDGHYPVHKRLFAENKWALECVANLARIPATGATVFAAPLKVAGASGAPARVVAFW